MSSFTLLRLQLVCLPPHHATYFLRACPNARYSLPETRALHFSRRRSATACFKRMSMSRCPHHLPLLLLLAYRSIDDPVVFKDLVHGRTL